MTEFSQDPDPEQPHLDPEGANDRQEGLDASKQEIVGEVPEGRLQRMGIQALAVIKGYEFYAPFDVTPKSYGEDRDVPEGAPDRVDLIRPKHFDKLPDGTILTNFHGETAVKGQDEIDQDTRAGFMAWGVPSATETDGSQNTYYGPRRSK